MPPRCTQLLEVPHERHSLREKLELHLTASRLYIPSSIRPPAGQYRRMASTPTLDTVQQNHIAGIQKIQKISGETRQGCLDLEPDGWAGGKSPFLLVLAVLVKVWCLGRSAGSKIATRNFPTLSRLSKLHGMMLKSKPISGATQSRDTLFPSEGLMRNVS